MFASAWWTETVELLNALLPGGILAVWCLFAVNWRRAWPVLQEGGWVPLVLIVWMLAYVWSLVLPRSITFAGITMGNYWWQLLASGLLTGFALFCGYLQGLYGWEPETISLEPPEDHGDSGHHGHHH